MGAIPIAIAARTWAVSRMVPKSAQATKCKTAFHRIQVVNTPLVVKAHFICLATILFWNSSSLRVYDNVNDRHGTGGPDFGSSPDAGMTGCTLSPSSKATLGLFTTRSVAETPSATSTMLSMS